MSYYDILLAKNLSGGGGGVTVESLSVTENGTYTAPSGKAYTPVSVAVPNSYTASDEGKVVSNGALVSQTSQSITENGTYDTTLIDEILVAVSGGGGLVYESGVYTPTSNTTDAWITLSDTHSTPPFMTAVSLDPSSFDASSYVGALFTVYFNRERLFGISDVSTALGYGSYWERRRSSTGGSVSEAKGSVDYSDTVSTASSKSYSRYWVEEGRIRLSQVGNSSNQWVKGKSYKWVAVWAPTS